MAGELGGLVRRMQEQAGYWLDAKEQLVMDAEMHNKMIASLVQYATQQQLQGNKKSPGKKAKKWDCNANEEEYSSIVINRISVIYTSWDKVGNYFRPFVDTG